MTRKDLEQIIADYMIENNIGFLSLDASTNLDKTKVIVVISEEDEDDIQDYGYKC